MDVPRVDLKYFLLSEFLSVRVGVSLLSGSMTYPSGPSGFRDSLSLQCPRPSVAPAISWLERLIALEGLFYEVKSEM